MVIAYHAIFAAYGFWLPNDGRGSWTNEVWAPHLRLFGAATKTTERRSLARRPHDRALRLAAKESLLYPAVVFDEAQRAAIARGFGGITQLLNLVILACAIMPDHVHLVLLRHSESIETVVGYLKRGATRALTRESLHPLKSHRDTRGRTPTPWVQHGWYRYLNGDEEIIGAVDYVEKNPQKIRLPRQFYQFVVPFVGIAR